MGSQQTEELLATKGCWARNEPREATHAPRSVPCTRAHTGGAKWTPSAFKELVQLGEKSGGWEELGGRGLEVGLSKTYIYTIYIVYNLI